MVYKKRFSRTARPDNEFIHVPANTPAFGFIRNIQMNRFARQPVGYLDAESTERIPVVGFLGKKAKRLFCERIKTFFARTIPGITGDRASKQGRSIDRIMTRLALHERQLAADIVFYLSQFVRIVRPRQYVTMTTNRSKTEAMSFIQIFVHPFFINLICTAIFG